MQTSYHFCFQQIAEKSKESSLSPAAELQNDAKSSNIKIGEVSPEQEDDESDILETPPQQQQRKAKSTIVKMALLAPLCLINLIVFGAFSVLSPFFSKEVYKRACKFYVPRFVRKIVFDLPWIDWHQRCDKVGLNHLDFITEVLECSGDTEGQEKFNFVFFKKKKFYGIWLKI